MKTGKFLAIVALLFLTGFQGSYGNETYDVSEEKGKIVLDHIERILSFQELPERDAPLIEVVVHIIINDNGTISVLSVESVDPDYEQFVTAQLENSNLQNASIVYGQQYKVTVSFRLI